MIYNEYRAVLWPEFMLTRNMSLVKPHHEPGVWSRPLSTPALLPANLIKQIFHPLEQYFVMLSLLDAFH